MITSQLYLDASLARLCQIASTEDELVRILSTNDKILDFCTQVFQENNKSWRKEHPTWVSRVATLYNENSHFVLPSEIWDRIHSFTSAADICRGVEVSKSYGTLALRKLIEILNQGVSLFDYGVRSQEQAIHLLKTIERAGLLFELKRLNLSEIKMNSDEIDALIPLLPTHLTAVELKGVNDAQLVALKARCTSLKKIRCSGATTITNIGFTALLSLPTIEEIYLYQNLSITDLGLAQVANRLTLKKIGLPFAKISNEGLAHLRHLTQLQWLDLTFTAHSAEALSAPSLSNLEYLNLSLCEITDKALKFISQITKLKNLDLSTCTHLTDKGIKELSALTELATLNLSGLGISSKILPSLPRNLKALSLAFCPKITGSLAELPLSLHELNISENRQINDNSLQDLVRLTRLTVLNVSHCKLTDNSATIISNFNLTHLFIVGNAITDNFFNSFKENRKLRELDLMSTAITDQGVEQIIAKFPRLSNLRLAFTGVSDQGVQSLLSLRSLNSLDLRNCPITNQALSYLSHLTEMQELELGGCTLITDEGLASLLVLKRLKRLSIKVCQGITAEGFRPFVEKRVNSTSRFEIEQ